MKAPVHLLSAGFVSLAAALLSAHAAELKNISTRALVGTGDNALIPGFVISGPDSQRILLRAVGPSLASFGVSGPIADPTLTLYRGTDVLATNDNWSSAANAAEIASTGIAVGAFPLAAGSKDAAILVSLQAGAYTAVVSGVGNTTGTALVELYAVGDTPVPLSLRSPVVDTGQSKTFDATAIITAPSSGQPFYGQDAQFSGTQPSYTKSSDGLTVKDNVTGLTWQKSPDTNGDGKIDSLDKMTLAEARARPAVLNAARYGGYTDWRLPTIKELYSLMNFSGTDPSGATGNDTSGLTPFIDRAYFDFGYGDTARGDRIIDMQYASSTLYVSKTMLGSPTMFGVNFADGRIKGYTLDMSYQGPGDSKFPVRLVRGAAYGENDFADNGDGTLSDRASGLMWMKGDSATGMNWQEALAWVQSRNVANYLGHSDWRLPNAKELQNIVDYGRSPDTTVSAAISPLFTSTGITNEAGKADYPYYWTSTTHESQAGGPGGVTGGSAVYIAFGRAMGYMTDPSNASIGAWLDVHGAGAQRSDPKVGNPADFPKGRGPQGDAIRIYNYVRLVRDVK